MNSFYEWAEKFGYTRSELMNNYKLREILLDEYANLELFHREQVEESRGKHK